ncbi:MAG: VOC family protein [Anaerolineae bacterium]
MEPRISIITLGVADLERSVRFYRDGLGLPLPGGAEGIAFFELQGTWLALYPHDLLAEDAGVAAGAGPRGFTGITLAQNLRSKVEVDAVMQEAVRAGATLVKEPQDVFWGGYSGYFADPDGYLWELAWNPDFPLDGGDVSRHA